ncbi:hypothetical protein C5167_007304 [Papaver somniferum]|nr:hypothetical protein C5167_007304 [Papaver somniferum]
MSEIRARLIHQESDVLIWTFGLGGIGKGQLRDHSPILLMVDRSSGKAWDAGVESWPVLWHTPF